jgi:hypothetical protein
VSAIVLEVAEVEEFVPDDRTADTSTEHVAARLRVLVSFLFQEVPWHFRTNCLAMSAIVTAGPLAIVIYFA